MFIVAPMVLAFIVRTVVIRRRGEEWLKQKVIARIKPLTMIALLVMLTLIFVFQGQKIGSRPLHILLIAIPIVLQTSFNFTLCYFIGFAHSLMTSGTYSDFLLSVYTKNCYCFYYD